MKLPVDRKVQQLQALYHAADLRLQALISAAVARGAAGTAAYYSEQLTAIRRELASVQADAVPLATQIIGDAYVQGVTYVDEAIGTTGAFVGVHTEAVNVLADNMVNRLNDAAQTVGRQAEDVFRRIALDQVSLGLLSDANRTVVSSAMARRLADLRISAFVDKAGRKWSLTSYTKMVARTTTREAVSHGTANRLLENGHDLVTISEHGGTDDVCAPYAGQTFSLTGMTDGYDVLDQYPPFHPNCIHVLTPASATFDSFEQAVASADNRGDRSVQVA
jgi:hypothetical protein